MFPQTTSKTFFPSTFLIVLLLALACGVTFLNSLGSEFMMDDYCILRLQAERTPLRFLQLTPETFSADIYFRPLMHFIHFVTVRAFGLKTYFYTLANLLIFYFAGATLYFVLRRVLRDWRPAFLASLFFLIHPMNGVFVNYKNVTGFSVMMLAVNLSFLLFLKSEEGGRKMLKLSSLCLFVVGLFCHEMMVMVPFYLGALLYAGGRDSIKIILKKTAPFFIILLIYVPLRFFGMTFASLLSANAARMELSVPLYLSALARLFGGYILRLVSLQRIVLIWDAPVVSQGAWVAAGILLACLAAGLGFIVRCRDRGPFVLGVSWMMLGLAPVALASLTRADFGVYIEPHWLPYASTGFFIILAALLLRLRQASPKLGIAALGLILFFQMFRSIEYNFLWRNQKRYCSYWQTVAPQNYWVNLWLGLSYLSGQEYLKARDCFERILARGIENKDTLGNMAIAEFHLKNYDRALKFFNRSLALFPDEPKTCEYLGRIYLIKGETPKAQEYFKKARDRRQSFPSRFPPSVSK